jgi:hypothetical protein
MIWIMRVNIIRFFHNLLIHPQIYLAEKSARATYPSVRLHWRIKE